jgi:hypothetical protein
MKIPFTALEMDEALSTYFPNLMIPRWSFSTDNPDDLAMGRYIWERVCPVLRRARSAIRLASKLAMLDGASRITLEYIKEAFTINPDDEDEDSDEDVEIEEDDDETGAEYGSHEKESHQRQAAKEETNRRREQRKGRKP